MGYFTKHWYFLIVPALFLLFLFQPQNSFYLSQGDKFLALKSFQSAFENYHLAALKAPNDPLPHFRLSILYQLTNNWDKATSEILLSQDSHLNSESVNQELTKIRLTQNQPSEIKKAIQNLQATIKDKPDYRDAYLLLAVDNYELYEDGLARDYLEKALKLDPNYPIGLELKKIILP